MPEDSVATRSYPPAEPNDAAVVREMQAGDDRRFPTIHHRYDRRLFAMFFAILRDPERAEEFTQQTWYVFTVQLQHVDPEQDLGCWLRGVARRLLAQQRRQKPELMDVLPDDESPLPPSLCVDGPAEELARAERQAEIDWVRANLSEQDWQLLAARYVEGTHFSDMERETGVNQRTLQSRAMRLLGRARRLVTEYRRLRRGWRGAVGRHGLAD